MNHDSLKLSLVITQDLLYGIFVSLKEEVGGGQYRLSSPTNPPPQCTAPSTTGCADFDFN